MVNCFRNLSSVANYQIQTNGLIGTIVTVTNADEAKGVISTDVAYLDCDPGPGFLTALDLLNQIQSQSAQAVVLFTTTSMTCNYTAGSTPPFNPYIYTMSNQQDSRTLYSELTQPSNNGWTPASAIIKQTNNNGNNAGNNQNSGSNPLGPSPSTAVAMIILYSITGVITALFLIIIVTGAVRAHRHPERYGPRNVSGRPRQSRAKGLARAMLETIPIVKFGEKPPVKESDVEMGPTTASDVSRERPTQDDGVADQRESERKSTDHANPTTDQIADAQREGSTSVSAAAAAQSDANSPAAQSADNREGLGCSICTEDFERGQDIRLLPCDHKFHPACIDPWLLNVSGTCPLCRIDLRPTTSHSSDQDADNASRSSSYAPPLAENDGVVGAAGGRAAHRQSTLRNILHMRSAEERRAALRELREEELGQTQETGQNNDVARRRNRVATRLHDAFRVRTRRGANAAPEEQSSTGDVEGVHTAGPASSTE